MLFSPHAAPAIRKLSAGLDNLGSTGVCSRRRTVSRLQGVCGVRRTPRLSSYVCKSVCHRGTGRRRHREYRRRACCLGVVLKPHRCPERRAVTFGRTATALLTETRAMYEYASTCGLSGCSTHRGSQPGGTVCKTHAGRLTWPVGRVDRAACRSRSPVQLRSVCAVVNVGHRDVPMYYVWWVPGVGCSALRSPFCTIQAAARRM
ncbi:hypothetical protein C8T65DRAFT_25617 [Cerioporus squamosus]|nr:hypothetical protein C8T65DRAFT_25617 [Cerioporus squamosus]